MKVAQSARRCACILVIALWVAMGIAPMNASASPTQDLGPSRTNIGASAVLVNEDTGQRIRLEAPVTHLSQRSANNDGNHRGIVLAHIDTAEYSRTTKWDGSFSFKTTVEVHYHTTDNGTKYYIDVVYGKWHRADQTVQGYDARIQAECTSFGCLHNTYTTIGVPALDYTYSYYPSWSSTPSVSCSWCTLRGRTVITLHHVTSTWTLYANAWVLGG